MSEEDWRKEAACRDLPKHLFFDHEQNRQPLPDLAREACDRCPVKWYCREWAIAYEHYGFWAGTTAKERARIRRKRGYKRQALPML